MTLAALLLRLRADRAGTMPVTAGRLLHGALFHLLQSRDPELSAAVHDAPGSRPFALDELRRADGAEEFTRGHVQRGDIFLWRVATWNEDILHILLDLPAGLSVRVGRNTFTLEAVVADRARSEEVGCVDAAALVEACMERADIETISLHFLSPVSFRSFTDDYPFPLPELIFGSLADKWRQMGTPFAIDRDALRESAAALIPVRWSGESRTVFLEKQRGVTGFIGSFTFSLHRLSKEERGLFLLLAQFAFFSGVGRLTAQGLGQTRCAYE